MIKNVKWLKRLFVFSVCSLFMITAVYAQTDVSGTVTDENGDALIGVSVSVKGTGTGMVTGVNGNFRLSVANSNATLVFSYLGFHTEEIPLQGRRTINVVMKESTELLDEVVVVGYGTQRRQSITGSVAQISGSELLKAPVGNITSRLGGVVPGVIALQQSGQPGADAASLLVRGSASKYIVDGIQRDFAEIDPNEIATVSILKDAASAAVYGLDANSVVIITTKRGQVAPSKISFTAAYGISANAYMLDMLDGPQYAYWYNMAREMDGDTPIFSSDHVAKMRSGEGGWGNTDWYGKTFGTGHTRNYNVNATGGNDKIKYFVSLGNYQQEGNVKNFDYNRYNLRSNIDANIAQNLDLSFNVSGRVEERDRPYYSAEPGDWNNIPQQAIRAHPYVPETIEGMPVSTRTASSYVNPLAAADQTGYNRSKRNVLETSVSLNYNVPFIQGLSLKFMSAYDYSYQTSKSFSTPYYTYVANRPTSPSGDISYTYTNDARGVNASLRENLSHYTHFTTNTSIKYENKFGPHSITGLALFETVAREGNGFGAVGVGFDIYALDELSYATLKDRNEISGSSYQQRVAGYLGRLNYDYSNKYLAEVSFRYDGSYLFGGMEKGKRWAPFPAASLGWRMSEESWFSNSVDFVNNLKLRGSIGLTSSTSGVPAYTYLNTMGPVSNVVVIGGTALNGLNTSSPANTNLTWPKSLQYNAGFEATLWRGLLGMEFDVFYKYMYDIIATATGNYPPSFGGYTPSRENVDKQDHKGFEIVLSHRKSFGDFSYRMAFNGTYTVRRWLLYSNDSPNTPDWLKLTGKEVGAQVGFISLGLFNSWDDVANSATMPGKDVRPGDIKYLDRNGDGVITYEQDRGYIGKSAYPKFVGGFNFDAAWKGFDMSFLLQGALGRDVALTGVYSGGIMDNTSMTKAFYHEGNSPVFLIENSWREDNTGASFPRLSIAPPSTNNGYSSSLWYKNGDYLRLKTAQIGFTLPKNIIKQAGIHNARIYAEGQNLLTFSGLSKYQIDPEQPGVSNGYYPQQRIYSFGINVTF
jgi:TonB-linked SusC/RagA family outer membrane protein